MTRLARSLLVGALAACAVACGRSPGPPPKAVVAHPCLTVQGDDALRSKEGAKTLDQLGAHITLAPDDEALRTPRSLEDVRKILRRDLVYFFPAAAAYARGLDTLDGRFNEATLELLMGESQLVGSQVLTVQSAWVSSDLRIARATLATERGEPTTDRGRMLAQLVRVVEEGNAIADALGAVGPAHVARGAEVIHALRKEAPDDPRTALLVAEYHRLRGEWPEFDAAMTVAEASSDGAKPALRYLRGMEQVERFHRPEQGAQIMREVLAAFPRFVRAQAALVLMARDPRAALRELARLKQMNDDHYLVMLLEPTLAADQELARLQNASGSADGAR